MKLLATCLAGLLLALAPGCGSDGGEDPPDNPGDVDAGDNSGPDAGTGSDSGVPGSDAMPPPASGEMTFFVTSTGNGTSGGNYGGLAGADQRCQTLAATVAADDRTWCAYLSNAAIAGRPDLGPLMHARDRIGTGPWYNAAEVLIAADVASLHANGIVSGRMLDEQGNAVINREHDLLTGTSADGELQTECQAASCTCLNWTSNDSLTYAWVGHTDDMDGSAWSDAGHRTRCDQMGMGFVNGSGRLMCFATNAGSCPIQ